MRAEPARSANPSLEELQRAWALRRVPFTFRQATLDFPKRRGFSGTGHAPKTEHPVLGGKDISPVTLK